MTDPTTNITTPGPLSRGTLLLVGGLLVIAAVVLLLMPVPYQGRIAVAIGDLVHAPLFGSLALSILILWQRYRQGPKTVAQLIRRCVWVAVCVIVFGAAMEVVQRLFGRTGNLHDAVANSLGVIAATLLYVSFSLRRLGMTRSVSQPSGSAADYRLTRLVLPVISLFLIGLACWRPFVMLRDAVAVYQGFPTLSSFGSAAELDRWYFRECRGELSEQNATDGRFAMEVHYQKSAGPSVTLVELNPDWSAMKTLEMDVTLNSDYPESEAVFFVSVLDRHHADFDTDLWRRQWSLRPGQTEHLRITRDEIIAGPASRKMDLSKIRFVDLSLSRPVVATKVHIDAVKLTLQD
ncbi:MAG: hypothetical protein HKN47_21635 [Pirellulaceae bacterium]|nr:hypothetical protein [Pirellulaceae bacterium]